MEPRWTTAFPLRDLPRGGARLFRHEGQQVAFFRTEEGRVYAVDNACPHEGYPLVQGAVKDCTLTCIWHNYKFDLRDGACVMGEEAVRSYPTRVVAGQVQVDVAEPDPATRIPGWMDSLEQGLLERRLGQAARDCARLLKAGVRPEALLGWLAAFDATRAEYGCTHALPVAADLAGYLPRYPGPAATLPLAQALDLVSESHVRRPRRPRPAPVDPGDDPVAAGHRLEALVEAEQAAEAEALVRGAVARGWGRREVEGWLLRLCAAHFLDFGHQLIYVVRGLDLLDHAGWQHADEVLGGLVFGIVNGTREDLLPEWAGWRKRIDALTPELPALLERQLAGGPAWWKRDAWLDRVTDGKPAEAFEALTGALREGVPLTDIVDGLSLAASERILRFDVGIDGDVSLQNGWLDVTHLLTFVNALRHAVPRLREPASLRLVYQALHFVNHARALDARPEDRPAIAPGPGGVPGVMAAIGRKDAPGALAALDGIGDDREALEALRVALEDLPLRDAAVRPIVVAHLVKTTVAAFQEHAALRGDEQALRPLRALVRLAASPIAERGLARRVHEALGFVVDGRIPRSLT